MSISNIFQILLIINALALQAYHCHENHPPGPSQSMTDVHAHVPERTETSCCSMYVKYDGVKIGSHMSSSANMCHYYCKKKTECMYYSFNSEMKKCKLYSSVSSRMLNPSYMSGPRSCPNDCIAKKCTIYLRLDDEVVTAGSGNECQSRCQASPECGQMFFISKVECRLQKKKYYPMLDHYPTRDMNRRCSLKSCSRYCPEKGVSFVGGTMVDSVSNVYDEKACSIACFQHHACDFWTYNKKTKFCEVKRGSDLEIKVHSDGSVITGFKDCQAKIIRKLPPGMTVPKPPHAGSPPSAMPYMPSMPSTPMPSMPYIPSMPSMPVPSMPVPSMPSMPMPSMPSMPMPSMPMPSIYGSTGLPTSTRVSDVSNLTCLTYDMAYVAHTGGYDFYDGEVASVYECQMLCNEKGYRKCYGFTYYFDFGLCQFFSSIKSSKSYPSGSRVISGPRTCYNRCSVRSTRINNGVPYKVLPNTNGLLTCTDKCNQEDACQSFSYTYSNDCYFYTVKTPDLSYDHYRSSGTKNCQKVCDERHITYSTDGMTTLSTHKMYSTQCALKCAVTSGCTFWAVINNDMCSLYSGQAKNPRKSWAISGFAHCESRIVGDFSMRPKRYRCRAAAYKFTSDTWTPGIYGLNERECELQCITDKVACHHYTYDRRNKRCQHFTSSVHKEFNDNFVSGHSFCTSSTPGSVLV